MARSRTLADGSVFVESPRGSAKLSRLRAGVLLYECAGVLSVDFYEPMVALAQRELDLAGKLALLVDGVELRSVDTGYREAWTEWFKLHRERFHMRLLVRTKLMDMAASLANLFTGINVIKTYSTVGAWERACAQEVPGFRRGAQAVS